MAQQCENMSKTSAAGAELEPKQQETGRIERQEIDQKANSSQVAFFVGLKENFGPVSVDTDIIFDNVVTNIGSGYSTSTGRFTAPDCGTYQFNVTNSSERTKNACVVMLKNGVEVLSTYCEGTPWSTSSSVAILSLELGDEVWLQLLTGSGTYISYGKMFTNFSGFIIFPCESKRSE